MFSLFRPALLSLLFVLLHLCGAQDQTIGDKGTTLQGYEFDSDVAQHARIDLDQEIMETTTDNSEWDKAKEIYTKGNYSKKGDSRRTLQGFSTEAPEKMKNEGFYKLYEAYWKDGKYADTFVMAALDGTGDFQGTKNELRTECANKGSQYQNVWMYVIHEMEDAIDDCTKGKPEDNVDSVKAWDEAWAFYTGSLAEKDNGYNGKLLYTLAQKRCYAFGLCDSKSDATAPLNKKVLDLFIKGQKILGDSQCDETIPIKNDIVKLMVVPLLQGTIQYAFNIDQKGAGTDKERGEAWAFAAAMLPLVSHCDTKVADMLRKNFEPKVTELVDTPSEIVSSLSKIYGCLGFTCDDVGKLRGSDYPSCSDEGEYKAVPGTDKPAIDAGTSGSPSGTGETSGTDETSGTGTSGTGTSGTGTSGTGSSGSGSNPSNSSGGNDEKSGGSSVGKIVGIVVAVLVVLVVATAVFFFIRSRKPKVVLPPPMEDGGSFA